MKTMILPNKNIQNCLMAMATTVAGTGNVDRDECSGHGQRRHLQARHLQIRPPWALAWPATPRPGQAASEAGAGAGGRHAREAPWGPAGTLEEGRRHHGRRPAREDDGGRRHLQERHLQIRLPWASAWPAARCRG